MDAVMEQLPLVIHILRQVRLARPLHFTPDCYRMRWNTEFLASDSLVRSGVGYGSMKHARGIPNRASMHSASAASLLKPMEIMEYMFWPTFRLLHAG